MHGRTLKFFRCEARNFVVKWELLKVYIGQFEAIKKGEIDLKRLNYIPISLN